MRQTILRFPIPVLIACAAIIYFSALHAGDGEGRTKVIAVANKAVTPVKVHTQRGSFLLDGLNYPNVALTFAQDHWQVAVGNITWFTETQQGDKKIGTGASGEAVQGASVALSADGNTLAEGGYNDDVGIGAVWVFTRTDGVWIQQGNKLVGTGYDEGGIVLQGYSVSLSADGNTISVGGFLDSSNIGAVWIFTRTNGVWNQQGLKLVGSGAAGVARQGFGVALSADGNTLASGGPYDGNPTYNGAVWMFTRSGGEWFEQGSKLTPSDESGAGEFGSSTALSADGNTLASGGTADASSVGAVWIFTRSGGEWFQQGSKLTPSDESGAGEFGTSIALSADGNTLAVGGPKDDTPDIGAAWIFIRTNGVWTQQGSKLVGAGYDASGGSVQQGDSVALSADGNTLAVGGSADASSVGAVWIFVRRAGLWVQMGNKLVGTGTSGGTVSQQGVAVALSADGNTLAEGGPNDGATTGAVWVFV